MARDHSATVRGAIANARVAPTGTGIGQNRNLTGVGGISGIRSTAPKPKPSGGPAVAPPPAGTQSTALPWDRPAELQSGTAQKRWEDANAGIGSTREQRERYYGLEPGYNDWKANPYSQAALLQHQHKVGESGVREGGQGNQLYSGATINNERNETRRNALAFNSLTESLHAEQAQWKEEERAAERQREQEEREAQEAAIERAAGAELEPAPTGGGSQTGNPYVDEAKATKKHPQNAKAFGKKGKK